ncbi:hypothetical protein H4582DRAFT_2090297 [Lactarius indigo]|nr:hypothetical protein H4582DRAFT_2090297 [Lactarius indigo]
MTTSAAASGLEPMASEPQEPSAEIGNPRAPIPRRKKDSYASGSGVRKIVTRSAAKRSAADDIGEAAISTTYKTRRRAGVNNPSAARPNIKGKGERDKRTNSRKGKPLHPEEDPDNNWEDEAQPLNKPMEGTNEEASPAKEIVTRSAAKRSVADDIGEAAISTTYKTRRHAGNNNPNAARPNIKGKGKQDMKTSSRKGKPLHPEEDLDNNREVEAQPLNKPMEGTNEEASPAAEGEDNNNIVKQLEREVQSLKRFPDPTHQPDDEQQHAVAHIFRDDNGNREPIAIIPPGDDLIGTRGILPADRPLEDPTGVRSSGGLAEDGEGVGRRTTALSAEEIEQVAAAQAALPHDEAHADDEDYYPVRHPLLRTHSHPTNPRITPWLVHTDGTPMSRGRVRLPGVAFHTPITHDNDPAQVLAPEGFRANRQPHYIHFPITGPDGVERNASHVQIVGGANPFVLGLIPSSPHLYGKPLYAFPMLSAAGRAFIAHEDLVILASDKITDHALNRIGDESLTAEVTRYRAAAYEEERLAARIRQLQAMRLSARDDKRDCIYRLERANVFERISDEQSTWTARDFR